VPIFDNHIHLRAEFRGIEAAKDFERAGGTAILLTHSPYEDIPIRRAEDYDRAYAKTLAMAEDVRRTTRIQVFVALGPYPVDFLGLQGAIGRTPAIDVMRSGIDRAAQHIAEQKAIAFGEVGRPHVPVSRKFSQRATVFWNMQWSERRSSVVPSCFTPKIRHQPPSPSSLEWRRRRALVRIVW
jgi:TatD-related deoxyribonuclease